MQGAYALVCPSGSIDLLMGSSVAEADLQIKLLNDIIVGISNAAMSETNSRHTYLSRVNVVGEGSRRFDVLELLLS